MMDNLSVTLEEKSTSILLGVMFLFAALIVGVIAFFDGQSVSIAVTVIGVLCSGYFFVRAGNKQMLDADGIHIKTYFSEKHYAWDIVEKTKIIRTSLKNLPHIQFYIRGCKKTVLVYYTKRTLACLYHYYGEPDVDCVKKPPTNL